MSQNPARLQKGGASASAFIQVIFWGFRIQQDAASVKQDLPWILSSLFFLFCRHDFFYSGILEASSSYIWTLLVWGVSLCFVIIFFLSTCYRWRIKWRRFSQSSCSSSVGRGGNNNNNNTPNPGSSLKRKPLIFPCRTSHTRIFPRKHSFSYSYLFVGVPIGGDQGASGSLLSVGSETRLDNDDDEEEDEKTKQIFNTAKSWFHVEAADYLNRGNSLGLEGKLHAYLRSQVGGWCAMTLPFFGGTKGRKECTKIKFSQNEDPANYPHAYLVTAPRFLGYSFNPVSFWYLYSRQEKLVAMILEVNNTFDERRMYFLKSQENEHVSVPPHSEDEAVHHHSSSANFNTTWSKDFHVSPFNSRKGNYALNAHDPFSSSTSGNEATIINNTITLTSSKHHAKLVARVFSTQNSLDPSSLGLIEQIKLVASWWWVGFVTFPRILREAAKLFFLRNLHVWYRPEVLRGSIGRRETHDEK